MTKIPTKCLSCINPKWRKEAGVCDSVECAEIFNMMHPKKNSSYKNKVTFER